MKTPIVRTRLRWQRNWLCPCGSGKKYKKCCLQNIEAIVDQEQSKSLIDVYLENKHEQNSANHGG